MSDLKIGEPDKSKTSIFSSLSTQGKQELNKANTGNNTEKKIE
jgi:hypothetical protein